jgi:hypothetical protein
LHKRKGRRHTMANQNKQKKQFGTITFNFSQFTLDALKIVLSRQTVFFLFWTLAVLSMVSFLYYFLNGFGLAYNDARSHLNIGRRVVEGLKPGFAQLGSVWLPLPHLLMVPTIWSDFMWHSGLAGALQSMISYIIATLIIFAYLRKLGVGNIGSVVGALVFATNLNILYLQSTAMTELLLIVTMTAAVYDLMMWYKDEKIVSIVRSGFWIMLSTLIRYDGWFLFMFTFGTLALYIWKKYGYKTTEGMIIFFSTMAGFGIFLWFLWNQLIFKDALYFAFGPYSARTQQKQLEEAGVLATKGDLFYSLKIYLYAMAYNSNIFMLILSIIGAVVFWFDKNIASRLRLASLALLSPFIFNVLALYAGHSVLFVQGLSGNSWFNVRYGVMMMPSIAIFIGYLVHRLRPARALLISLIAFTTIFSFLNQDAVTLDDARFGSSGKNVTEVSGWLRLNAGPEEGFVLISAASHDAVIFSSGMPMSRFIHEGTGLYWDRAIARPDQWARYIIMRTNDENDLTFRSIKSSGQLHKYELVDHFPFADIYQLKEEYAKDLITKPILGKQK